MALAFFGLERLFCCAASDENNAEFKVVQLSSDVMECQVAPPVHQLTSQDAYDATVAHKLGEAEGKKLVHPVTPRQRLLKNRVQLPVLRRYPVPPGCSCDDTEEWRKEELLRIYQEFVLDLHKGMHMMQLTANQDYSDIHCQILEDLTTLKVDQGSGCIIEFPLTAVSKVYRIVKNDDKWYNAGSLNGPQPMPPLPLSNAEHIVVVEFMKRKLAFVFTEMSSAQIFLMCMELLIRRAQENVREAPLAGSRRFGGKASRGEKAISPMFSSMKPGDPGFGNKEKIDDRADEEHNPFIPCACQPLSDTATAM